MLGVRILGSNFMEAYNFYFNLGEYYFSLVSKNKGVLPAAKASYIIASENLIQINAIVKDEEMMKANKKKLTDLIQL